MPSDFIKENKKILSKVCLLEMDVVGMLWEAKLVREKPGDILLFSLIEKSTFRVQPYTQKYCRNIIREKIFLWGT